MSIQEYPLEVADWAGSPVFIKYTYSPGDPGIHTFPNGDPGYPPTGPEIEITSAVYGDGSPVQYEDDEELVEKWFEACEEDFQAQCEAEAEAEADYLRERQRERYED